MPSPASRFVGRLLLTLAFAACAATPPPAPVEAIVTAQAAAAPLAVAAIAPVGASEEHAAVPISPSDPTWGSRAAPVTIVVFADFQCPFCAKLEVTLGELRTAYGPEQLRIVWKNNPLPFHPNAKPAAEAAAGVFALRGNDGFWQFHGHAMKNQASLSEASYEEWASGVGIDPAVIRDGLADHRWRAKVEDDAALAAKLGANGTPASFVNGTRVSGAQPIDKFKEVIDPELEKSKDLARSGMPPDRVYLARAEANFTLKPPSKPATEAKDDPTTIYKVPVGRSPVRGKATALVTIVEFADFQCPYCSRVEPTLQQVRTTYGDQVRIVWKDEPLPFHPRAEPALEVAREARAEQGDAAFWKVHDALFASQPKLDDTDLETIAVAAGLSVTKVHHAIDQHVYQPIAREDADLADDVQASGTPHFFINGRRLVGAQPFEKFKSLIDEEIIHAKRLLAEGTPSAAVYEKMIHDGKGRQPFETNPLGLLAGAPSKGNATAQVVIQEVADFQCPFCRRAEDTLKEVLKLYGPKVRLVWRNDPLPMHPDAPLAAEAALEAFAQRGSAGFWEMHDLLYANQPAGNHSDGLKRPALDGYAVQLGLDMGRWGAALDGRTHKAAVEADMRAVSDAGITGTPAFVIGGYYISGAQPITRFRRVIDEVLAHGPAAVPAVVHHAAPVAHAGAVNVGPPGPTTVSADGLKMTDVVVGSGQTVQSGDHVTVHYIGTLTDGTVFDTSRTRGSPFEFDVGRGMVIKGWDQGLLGMKVGGTRKLVIPAPLAYGSRGAGGGKIPPDAVLEFEIELLSIR